MPANTYADDLKFLQQHTDPIELTGADGARVAVAPSYDARVMTSSLDGGNGTSFGWLNCEHIAAETDDPKFNNYGGEDRFWLGPEAGQFGLWFKAGEPFDMAHWTTPDGFDAGGFEVVDRGESAVGMSKEFEVANYGGTTFRCAVRRTVRLLRRAQLAEKLGVALGDSIRAVAFQTGNKLSNAGDREWTRGGGLLSVWTLGQFKPLPNGKVIVPFLPGDADKLGPRATTDYFGPIPPERCRVENNHLLFVCDGKFRSKIGISPARATSVLGSYDPDGGVLTIVQFNLPPDAPRRPYVNSLWEIQDRPFAGDAVNAYNDGEETPGAGQLGPFYEMETSSPAAELAPGETITHTHRTCHLAGEFDELNEISRSVLGVDLTEIA